MKIKNWSKFQHFKDRRPPWVKLYREILDDIEWHELDALASKVLVMCWLIASEDEGRLPNTKTLAFRLRLSEKQTIDCLNKLSHWLEQDDINVISERNQSDSLETERETEKEKETETKNAVAPIVFQESVSYDVWEAFKKHRKKKKAELTQLVVDGIQHQATLAGWRLEDAFKETIIRGWTSFKADWVADKQNQTETVYQRSMRLKMQEAVPTIAKQSPEPYQDAADFFRTIDVSVKAIEVNK